MIKRLFRSIFSFPYITYRSISRWIGRLRKSKHRANRSSIAPSVNQLTRDGSPPSKDQSAANSGDRILFSIPRDEVVRALNQTLWRSGTVPTHRPDAAQKIEYTDHPDFIQSLADSAYICECQGRYNEAERLYRQVLELSQRRYGEDHMEVANSLSDLAAFYCEQDRHGEAEALLLRLIAVRSQNPARPHAIGDARLRLGELYLHNAQFAKAEPHLRQAVELFSAAFGKQDARTQSAQTVWEQTRIDGLSH